MPFWELSLSLSSRQSPKGPGNLSLSLTQRALATLGKGADQSSEVPTALTKAGHPCPKSCQLSVNLLQLLSAVLFCLLLELPEGPSKALQLQLLGPQLSLPSPLLSLRKQAPGPAPDFTPSFPSHLIPRSPSPPGLGELLWCPGPLEAGPAAPTVPLPPPGEVWGVVQAPSVAGGLE